MAVGTLERSLIVVADCGQDGRNLAIALDRVELAGTLPGEMDVTVSPLHIAVGHEFVGQFPHRALVHHGVLDIAQGRLGDPVARLHRVAQHHIIKIAVECHDGILV